MCLDESPCELVWFGFVATPSGALGTIWYAEIEPESALHIARTLPTVLLLCAPHHELFNVYVTSESECDTKSLKKQNESLFRKSNSILKLENSTPSVASL